MLVVPDINDIFIPTPDDLLVNLKESKAVIESLLTKLPKLHASSQSVDSALGPALQAAFGIVVCSMFSKTQNFRKTLEEKLLFSLLPFQISVQEN
jgi:hypothetical protein